MLKKIFSLAIIICVVSSGWSADKLALTMKTKGDVQLIPGVTGTQTTLKRGKALFDGDKVITGDDGSVIILFLDDKTQLKLKGNSEAEITGSVGEGGISKRITMTYGSIKASVSKQKGEFIISTPTSVASVKGTEFWIISDPDSGDILINLSGTVMLTNVYTGETFEATDGVVMVSTPDGEVRILKIIKIIGDGVGAISGDQFGLSNIIIIEGEAESGDMSGIIKIDDNTIFEGAAISAGVKVSVLGVLDEAGDVFATLVGVAEPITIEAVASSSVSNNEFTIQDVVLISGEAENLPATVRITDRTSVEGGEVVMGAEVTVTGNFNTETGVLDAAAIAVVVPELKVTGRISSITSDSEFEISDITILSGNIDPSSITGKIVIVEGGTIEGGELTVGAKVTVSGTFDEVTGAILSNRIAVSQVTIVAVAASEIANNQFEINNVVVQDGDVDPSALSGVVKIADNTIITGGEIFAGVQVTIVGSVDEGTGDMIALEIVIPVISISGYVTTIISESEFELTRVAIIDGDVEESAISGKIFVAEGASVEGGDLVVGAKVEITGILNVDNGNIIANRVIVSQVTLSAIVSTDIVNNQFEIVEVSVLDGDVDASSLSGIVKITLDTKVEGGAIASGGQVTIVGSVDESTGDILAANIVVIVSEREIIFELENSQGNRKELIIKFQ